MITLADVAEEILATMPDAVVLLGLNREILFVNQAATVLTGFSERELVGQNADRILDRSVVDGMHADSPVGAPHAAGRFECSVFTREAGTNPVLLTANRVLGADGAALAHVLLLEDLTPVKKAEREVQRLEALHLMAGGIAHDLNNLLASVMAHVSIALADGRNPQSVREHLTGAGKAIRMAGGLCRRLAAFSSDAQPKRDLCTVDELVTESADIALCGSNVEVRTSVAGDIWPVVVDRHLITQAFVNLFVNAREAMPAGGTVRVSCVNRPADISAGPAHGWSVAVEVADEGCGIPAQNLSRVFEPFFTTKKGGTGLGLFIVRSCVEKNGGSIAVESSNEKGTSFVLSLPAAPNCGGALSQQAEESAVVDPKHVLVMDDDAMVGRATVSMLEHLGHRAEHTRNARQAIEEFSKSKGRSDPFDVVILDLNIRGGPGARDVAKRLQEIGPGVRAIVTSGSAHACEMKSPRDCGFDAMLRKPFTMGDLADVMRSA